MSYKALRRRGFLAVVLIIICLIVLTVSTFAWFSSGNREVSSSRVTANTSSAELKLLVSSTSSFTDASEAAITQENSVNALELLPVSTSDLKSFVYCPMTDAGNAKTFSRVEDEKFYYHGSIYLMASGKMQGYSDSVELYFDSMTEDGSLLSNIDGDILTAARLGLVFSSDTGTVGTPVILSLSDETTGNAMNTIIGGELLESGMVLSIDSLGAVTVSADPSVPYSDFTVDGDGAPQKSLCTMSINVPYRVDIYFYLEGCDPDCTESISTDGVDLNLRFYGLLA